MPSVSDTGLLQPGVFDGVNVADGDVICRYTYAGDVNLDGVVNSTDQSLIDADVDQYTADPVDNPTWEQGDLTYNGQSPPVSWFDQSIVQSTEWSAVNALPAAVEGQPYTPNLPAEADPEDTQNHFLPAVHYSNWLINWGDGSPLQSCLIDPATQQFDPVTHTYAAGASI